MDASSSFCSWGPLIIYPPLFQSAHLHCGCFDSQVDYSGGSQPHRRKGAQQIQGAGSPMNHERHTVPLPLKGWPFQELRAQWHSLHMESCLFILSSQGNRRISGNLSYLSCL